MNRKIALIIIGTIFVLLATANLVQADSLEFADEGYKNSCPCDPQSFKVIISNDNAEGEVYSLSILIDNPSYFSPFITPSVEVKGHSSELADVFLITACGTPAQNYSFTIKAVSSKGTQLTLKGDTSIGECHLLKMSATPEQSVCTARDETYLITLKNDGIFQETGSLITDLNPAYYELGNDKFDLKPGEETQIRLHINLPALMPPQKIPFKITAASRLAFRESFATLNVKDCSALEITVPSDIYVQPGDTLQTGVTLKNTGVDDSFALSLACPGFTKITPTSVSLDSGETQNATLTNSPKKGEEGDYTCTIKATSNTYGKNYFAQTNIHVKQLYFGQISTGLTGDAVTICKGESTTVNYVLKNTGEPTTYTLSATGVAGKLSTTSANLNKNQELAFTYATEPINQVGQQSISVRAKTEFTEVEKTVKVTVEDCFASALSAPAIELCPSETVTTTLTVQNTGTKSDDFTLTANVNSPGITSSAKETSFNVGSKSTKTVELVTTASANAVYGSTSELEVKANSKSPSTARIVVRVLPQSQCHALTITAPETLQASYCKGEVATIQVKNTGRLSESLAYAINGPDWVFLTPQTSELQEGETKQAYIYYAPGEGTQPGNYAVIFTASNSLVTQQQQLTIKLAGEIACNYEQEKALSIGSLPPLTAQVGVAKIIAFTVENKGDLVLHGVTIFIESDALEVTSDQQPFDLAPGEKKTVSFEVKAKKTGEYTATVRAASKEAFDEKTVPLTVTQPQLEIKAVQETTQQTQSGANAISVTYELTNKGTSAISIIPKIEGANATLSQSTILLQPNETKNLTAEITALASETPSFVLLLNTDKGVYSVKTQTKPGLATPTIQVSEVTGLFAGDLSPIYAFILAILIGAAVLYYALRQRNGEKKEGGEIASSTQATQATTEKAVEEKEDKKDAKKKKK